MSSQFVVQVDDRPGSASRLLRSLALRDINVHHIAGVTAGERAIVVLTVSDDVAARDVLTGEGYSFSEGQPLVLRVKDAPGALAEVADCLAGAGVNILTVLEVGRHGGWVDDAFTVDDLDRARDAIGACDLVELGWRVG